MNSLSRRPSAKVSFCNNHASSSTTDSSSCGPLQRCTKFTPHNRNRRSDAKRAMGIYVVSGDGAASEDRVRASSRTLYASNNEYATALVAARGPVALLPSSNHIPHVPFEVLLTASMSLGLNAQSSKHFTSSTTNQHIVHLDRGRCANGLTCF